jgi:ribosomal protein S6E (S10)
MKKLSLILGLSLLLLLNACSADTEKSVNDASTNLKDQVSNIRDKDEPHVLSVKNGHLQDHPDKSLGDAFKAFFGEPAWKYFKSTSGEDVVEFTGYMMYQDTKVKARLQFLLKENESFEIGALSFNNVPQNELIQGQVLKAVFEPQDKAK